jgi:hypothetical protein
MLRAKKRTLLEYQGDMLFQGINDDVVITSSSRETASRRARASRSRRTRATGCTRVTHSRFLAVFDAVGPLRPLVYLDTVLLISTHTEHGELAALIA